MRHVNKALSTCKCSFNRSHHYHCCCCWCVVVIIIISRKRWLLWRQSHCLPCLPLYPHHLGQCLGYNQCSANTWRTESQSHFLESWLFSPCVINLKSAPTLGSLSTWTQELSQELLMCQATKLRVLSYIDFLASAPLTFWIPWGERLGDLAQNRSLTSIL